MRDTRSDALVSGARTVMRDTQSDALVSGALTVMRDTRSDALVSGARTVDEPHDSATRDAHVLDKYAERASLAACRPEFVSR